jgi:hypothetical protein
VQANEAGTKQSFVLVAYLAYSSTLKIEAIFSSETLVDLHRATRRYIPQDRNSLYSLVPLFIAHNIVLGGIICFFDLISAARSLKKVYEILCSGFPL